MDTRIISREVLNFRSHIFSIGLIFKVIWVLQSSTHCMYTSLKYCIYYVLLICNRWMPSLFFNNHNNNKLHNMHIHITDLVRHINLLSVTNICSSVRCHMYDSKRQLFFALKLMSTDQNLKLCLDGRCVYQNRCNSY